MLQVYFVESVHLSKKSGKIRNLIWNVEEIGTQVQVQIWKMDSSTNSMINRIERPSLIYPGFSGSSMKMPSLLDAFLYKPKPGFQFLDQDVIRYNSSKTSQVNTEYLLENLLFLSLIFLNNVFTEYVEYSF